VLILDEFWQTNIMDAMILRWLLYTQLEHGVVCVFLMSHFEDHSIDTAACCVGANIPIAGLRVLAGKPEENWVPTQCRTWLRRRQLATPKPVHLQTSESD
jgi:hypothetical protein